MYKYIISAMFFGYIYLSTGTISQRKPLLETMEYLQGEERKINGAKLSLDHTQFLLDSIWDMSGCMETMDPNLCQGCMQASELFYIIDANKSIGLEETDFQKASVVILHHLGSGICKAPAGTSENYTYVDYLYDIITTQTPSSLSSTPSGVESVNKLPDNLSFSEEQLHYILDLIKDIYKPKTVNKQDPSLAACKYKIKMFMPVGKDIKCFSSKDVFEEVGLKLEDRANEKDLEEMCAIVITNLLRGDCIGRSKTVHPKFFIDSIYENYGTFGTILEHDFEELFQDLGIGKHAHHNHQIDRSWRDKDIKVHEEHAHSEMRDMRRAVLDNEPHGSDTHHDHAHNEVDHHDDGEHESESLQYCFSFQEILDIYEIDDNVGSESTFNTLCPALVEQIVSHSCDVKPVKKSHDQSIKVYLWATIAVFLVTLCSMIGIMIIPLASVKVYTGIMHLFVALAVSTLSGDALLHLIPEALGLHTHSDHQHHAEEKASPEQVLSKVLVVVAAIYAFFLFERLMMACLGRRPHAPRPDRPDKLGELTDNPDEYTPAMFQAGNTIEMDDIDDEIPEYFSDVDCVDKYSPAPPTPVAETLNNRDSAVLENLPENSNHQYQSHELTDTLFVERKKKELEARTSFSLTKGIQTVSVMVLIADAVHNATDGIAIGVAFTLDIYVGISTCVAVFCHELPHEIGDFAVLLKNGLNFRTALFWSLMSNLCGFIGVYIGIALGSNEDLHQWIFAGTAGMFLYIALVDLMPEITHDPAGFTTSVFLMHNIGLLVGWSLMVVLAFFEKYMGGHVAQKEEPIPV